MCKTKYGRKFAGESGARDAAQLNRNRNEWQRNKWINNNERSPRQSIIIIMASRMPYLHPSYCRAILPIGKSSIFQEFIFKMRHLSKIARFDLDSSVDNVNVVVGSFEKHNPEFTVFSDFSHWRTCQTEGLTDRTIRKMWIVWFTHCIRVRRRTFCVRDPTHSLVTIIIIMVRWITAWNKMGKWMNGESNASIVNTREGDHKCGYWDSRYNGH